jgi:tocopherol cyclase
VSALGLNRLAALYRRSGADLPGGDPRPTHGAEMEGWFWRLTDASGDQVVLALCGINRHPDGDWATVGVAAHPGGIVRSAVVPGAHAAGDRMHVVAPGVLEADDEHLRVELHDVRLTVRLERPRGWPHRLGAGGAFSAVPFLGQYWHPHVLGGGVRGSLAVDGRTRPLDGAVAYAEKNWGAGFPDAWWWGQAQGFTDPRLCVAFGGGRLRAGPVTFGVTGCVVALPDRVLRFAPPTALVRATADGRRWEVDARRPGWRLELQGSAGATAPAVLPVPLPQERRNVDRDLEHLVAELRVRLWRRGALVVDDTSRHAALEVGALDPTTFAGYRTAAGLPAAEGDEADAAAR